MKKLVIERKRWGRGATGGHLLDGYKRMCCLGFHAIDVGFGPAELDGKSEPDDLKSVDRRNNRDRYSDSYWLFDIPKNVTFKRTECKFASNGQQILININDAEGVDDATREAWLTEGFRVLGGIEVEFVDGPVTS